MNDKTLYQNYAAQLRQQRQSRFDAIEHQHFAYQERHLAENTDPTEILAFINRVRTDALHVTDVEQRSFLHKMLHMWVAVIYDDIGYYPQTDLLTPLEWLDEKRSDVRF